jgi:protein O-GlcNAc transferase
MLFDAIKKLLFRRTPQQSLDEQHTSFVNVELIHYSGDFRTAIAEYRKHLERFPYDVSALNNLACCLDEIGDSEGGGALLELAVSLDDTFRPALVNNARYLLGKQRLDDALKYLRQAKVHAPEDSNILISYASIALNKGDAEMARRHSRNAWLGMFDNLRAANCFIFNSTYADIDEALLAAEHRFWAETILPLPAPAESDSSATPDGEEKAYMQPVVLPAKGHKIRIAYWSPDFRNHSVRFFSLPLLENHDRERFEIIAYHDSPHSDERTDDVKKCCDFFIPVSEMPDEHLLKMMRSHQLDILVELAGHTSSNRINLLQQRLATRQLTGLGYPPTTGLNSFDGKFLDSHIVSANSARYYTEPPLVLDSFWCFDPKEDPEICMDPPVIKNGYVTFACVGNIAKISRPIMECWAKILERVPDSRLLIRSISLKDTAATKYISDRFQQAGLDLARVDLLGPAGGAEFFASYNDVDIILDTFPFNGGTTTCFATYMGVPVLSMAGQSLLSRMGKSILSNLGLQSWVVTNHEQYVEQAVMHAQDVEFLSGFRSQARSLYSASSLGNGKLFARDFEKHCVALLSEDKVPPQHQVAALPAEEIVARIFTVMRYGQFEAAMRIVDHCLREYPDCGAAHVLWTYRLTEQQKFAEAIAYLEERQSNFSSPDQFTALLNIARFNILLNQPLAAKDAIDRMSVCTSHSLKDQLYSRMLHAYLAVIKPTAHEEPIIVAKPASVKGSVAVLIVCDDLERYDEIKNSMQKTCKKVDGMIVSYEQCDEKNRCQSYREHLKNDKNDIVIVIQKNIELHNKNFFSDIASALEKFDIVSFGGAMCWDRLDWRHSPAKNKAISFLIPSGEAEGFCEINFAGFDTASLVGGMVVLDGNFLAIKTAALRSLDISSLFDPMLEGGGILQEEYFSHAAFGAGLTLAVHQSLGVFHDWRISMEYDNVEDARWHITEKMSFDPFMEDGDDRSVVSMPLPSTEQAMQVLERFLNISQ